MWWCCCCDTGDDFNRADNQDANLGGDWDAQGFEISGNKAVSSSGTAVWLGSRGDAGSLLTLRVNCQPTALPFVGRLLIASGFGVEYRASVGDPPDNGGSIAILNGGSAKVGNRWTIGSVGAATADMVLTYRPPVGMTPANLTASVGGNYIYREITTPDELSPRLEVTTGTAAFDNWICPACDHNSPTTCGIPSSASGGSGNYIPWGSLLNCFAVDGGYKCFYPHDRGEPYSVYGPQIWEWQSDPDDPAHVNYLETQGVYALRWGDGSDYTPITIKPLREGGQTKTRVTVGGTSKDHIHTLAFGATIDQRTIAIGLFGNVVQVYVSGAGTGEVLTFEGVTVGDGVYWGYPVAVAATAPDALPALMLSGGAIRVVGLSQRGGCNPSSVWDGFGCAASSGTSGFVGAIPQDSGGCPSAYA